MVNKIIQFGEKTEEYPFGYGYCQCGCGRKAPRFSNGTYLKYVSRHKFLITELSKLKIGEVTEEYPKGFGYCQCGCGQKTRLIWKTYRKNGKRKFVAMKYVITHYSKTTENRKRQSELATSQIKDRFYSPFVNYGRSESGLCFSKKLGGQIPYMSSYEKRVFELLDNDVEVIEYHPQPFDIQYMYKNEQRTYTPDVLIYYKDGRKVIVEVKPRGLIGNRKNIAKFEAMIDYCERKGFKFEIWDENTLKKLELRFSGGSQIEPKSIPKGKFS